MKILDGKELAGFIKEKQAHEVNMLRGAGRKPKLVIIRDGENPVIMKYVALKKKYGEDIRVEVVDVFAEGLEALQNAVKVANEDKSVSGIIVQLPLKDKNWTQEVTSLILPEKDVDGLNEETDALDRIFDSATATAINWLMAGYNIELARPTKIALVGRGKLVGAPLERMWENSGFDVTVFRHEDDLSRLRDFDVIVTATGNPRIIKSEMVRTGATVVDAGTASEDGVLVGDVAPEVRERGDLAAITPVVGGVGPLTVSALFDNVIRAAGKNLE